MLNSKHLSSKIFFTGLLIFCFGLWHQEFIGFDSRFALFAKEMWQHGISLFPMVYGKPYPDYPVTQTVLIYLSSFLTGGVTVFSGVFPTAIAAAITLTLTYKLGALQSKKWGMYAALLLLLTYEFLASARSLSTDQFITTITIACFYLAYTNQRLAWIPVLALFGFLIRGPIGLVIPTGVVVSYYLVNKDYKRLFITGSQCAIVLVLAIVMLLTAAYFQAGIPFVKKVWGMQVAGRIASSKPVAWYYYITHGFGDYAISFPLFCITAISALKNKTSKDYRFILHLIAWVVVILIGMSLPGDKKIRYILPITPALALAAAYIFVAENQFVRIKKALTTLFCLLPIITILALFAGHHILVEHQINIDDEIVALMLFIVFFAGLTFKFNKAGYDYKQFGLLSVALVTIISIQLFMVEPIELAINKTKPFAEKLEAIKRPDQDLVFYKMGPDGYSVKLMVNTDELYEPHFADTAKQVLEYKKPAVFVARVDRLQDKSLLKHITVLAKGKVGTKDCVIFMTTTPLVGAQHAAPGDVQS